MNILKQIETNKKEIEQRLNQNLITEMSYWRDEILSEVLGKADNYTEDDCVVVEDFCYKWLHRTTRSDND